MENSRLSIDEYVDSLYNGLDAGGDAAELKEEMRGHLEDAARRLLEQGYSREDAVRIAIERFGDQTTVRRDLNSLYSAPEPSQTQPPVHNSGHDTSAPRTGISALVYAILAVFVPLIGIAFGIVALIRAVRNLRRPTSRTVAPMVSGLAIGIAILALLWQVFYILGIGAFALAAKATSSVAGSSSVTQSATGGP